MREDQLRHATMQSWVLGHVLRWKDARADKFNIELTNLVTTYQRQDMEERERENLSMAALRAQQLQHRGPPQGQQPRHLMPFQGPAPPPPPQQGPVPGHHQMDQFKYLQALLQGLQASGAIPGGAAPPPPTSAAARPPPQARPPAPPAPLGQAETYVSQGYVAPAVYVTGVDTYGTPRVPYTTTSSSFVPGASEPGHITTTSGSPLTYTQLETVVAGSSMDNGNYGNLTLPSGSSPMVSAAVAMGGIWVV